MNKYVAKARYALLTTLEFVVYLALISMILFGFGFALCELSSYSSFTRY